MPIRTVVEHGTKDKRSVAFSLDWPGWSRGAKSAELALETLESYRVRYRPVAVLAAMASEFDPAGPLEVVEERVGTGSTDFWGISFSPSSTEHGPMDEAELERRLATLRGEVELPIPAASAVKIGGERAYRLHRQGMAVEMPVRRSTVHKLRVCRYEPPLAELDLLVSSGTYVRSLAEAVGGHCRSLRRTEVGPFRVEEADPEIVLPPLAALVHLPARELGDDELRLVRSGRAVAGKGDGPVALYHGGELVAVGQADEGAIRPETVLPA